MDKIISAILIILLLAPLSSSSQNCNVLFDDFSSYTCHDCSIIDESNGGWIKYHPGAAEARIYNAGIASDPILDIASEFSQPDNQVASQVIQVLNIDAPDIIDYSFTWYNECGILSIDFLESFVDASNVSSLGYLVFEYDEITIGGNTYDYCVPWTNEYNEVKLRLDFSLGELSLNCNGTLRKLADFTASSDQLYGVAWGSNQCNYVQEICVNNLTQLVDLDEDSFTNDIDCDDNNPSINPAATEIPNNGIDEDCDGADLITSSTNDDQLTSVILSPNPTSEFITTSDGRITAVIGVNGSRTRGSLSSQMDVSNLSNGLYVVEVNQDGKLSYHKLIKR